MTIRSKPIGSVLLAVLCGVLIAGCNGSTVSPTPTITPSGPQAFTWDHNPLTTVFQLNRALTGELRSYALNRLPLCTLYGDGRLVWTTYVPATGQQVLQTTLGEADTRAFLAYVISDQHFFSVPDYAARQITPGGSASLDTMTTNLIQGTYTVRNYGLWPNNEFQPLLDKCTHLANDSIPYQPTGGWMGVEPIEGISNDPAINWGNTQPFQLAPLIHQQPIWLSGDALQVVWRILRRGSGAVQWVEGNERYRVYLQIPGLSPGAPPAPSITPTPLPSVTPLPRGTNPSAAAQTRIPFVTRIPTNTPLSAATASQ